MTALSIVRPGMFSTVQDLGRWGFQSRGVPVSGAMDWFSHRLANRLVGNSDAAATIEVTLMGPEMAFEGDTGFAVTGARFGLTLDAAPVEMNRMIEVRAGSILKFGAREGGARSYVALAGGVDVPRVLGSRSTHVLTRMGGLEGRALRAGDRLFTIETIPLDPLRLVPALPLPSGGARLRVIPGEPRLFAHLSSQRFRISPRSDRMGYRLEGGSPAGEVATGEQISSAVTAGAIQVPPAGQPILLMADRPTTGGYGVGATVITADLPAAAQLAPGDWVEFELCSSEAADQALRELEVALGSA